MRLAHPLRLPLSTGASPVELALGVGIFGFVGAAPIFLGSVLPNWVVLPCGLLIAVWFFALGALPWVVKNQRASDVVIGADGLEVIAGPFRGRRLLWQRLVAEPPVLVSVAKPRGSSLYLPEGITVQSEVPDEILSLTNLVVTLRALSPADTASDEPPAPPVSIEVVACSACGAPLTPSHEPSARCAFCQAVVVVPDSFRREVGHLRALARRRRASARALEHLQRWPRAPRVNRVIAVAVVPLVLGWPVSAVVSSEFFQYRDVFTWRDCGVLFVATVAVTLGLVFWLQAQTVHRQAFALVVASFHAVRLDTDGVAYGCHRCGAPLAVEADMPLTVCAYCRADNVVLGLDLPPRIAAEREQAEALDAFLVRRMRSMRTWRVLTAVAAGLLIIGAALLRGPLTRAIDSPLPRHAPIDRAWSYPGPS